MVAAGISVPHSKCAVGSCFPAIPGLLYSGLGLILFLILLTTGLSGLLKRLYSGGIDFSAVQDTAIFDQ